MLGKSNSTSLGLFVSVSPVMIVAAFFLATTQRAGASEPASFKKYLLLDSRIIDSVANAKLVLGKVKKHPANPLFGEDKPWEPRYDNMYPNVIYDEEEQVYKCWYTPFVTSELDERTPRPQRGEVPWHVSKRMFGLCYALSRDGLKWDKPELGLVDFRGSKRNNILMFQVHGPGIVKDPCEKDPARRYKMFGAVGGLSPHQVWFSPDGLRWSEPLVLDLGGRSDTRNNVLWSSELSRWVGITRFDFAPRSIGRTSSEDFVRWSKVQEVLRPEPDQPHFHDMVAFPYGGLYLGLLGVFDVRADRQWVELTWSPDSIQWQRILPGTPFIPNSRNQGDYDWGCIFAAQPVMRDGEIRIYYAGCNGKFHNWRDGFLCLATLRPDGFAGYAPESVDLPGVVTTKPVAGRLAALHVTVDVDEGGSLVATAIGAEGKELARSQPIANAVTDAPLQWQDSAGLDGLATGAVQLKFLIKKATLYAFSFDGIKR
ncbi:MAG: hypothetical protein HY717_02170 [Planctomycetes bacterium]|nr:hypothetical protein [Planctomycetota bacterium]